MFLSILKSSRHELRIAYGFTLITPSFRGWEAFPTPRALTHTRITWDLSPTAPQIPGVIPGSPLCLWCFGHSRWRGARHDRPQDIPDFCCSQMDKPLRDWGSLLGRVWAIFVTSSFCGPLAGMPISAKFWLWIMAALNQSEFHTCTTSHQHCFRSTTNHFQGPSFMMPWTPAAEGHYFSTCQPEGPKWHPSSVVQPH